MSDPEKAKPDERLCGMWKPTERVDNTPARGFLFIGKVHAQDVPEGIMKALALDIDTNNEIRELSLYFFTTLAADDNYASFFWENVVDPSSHPAWNKKNMRSFGLYKYKVEGDKLTIWDLDDGAVEAAVHQGLVKGKIEGKNTKTVTLTHGEDLLRYLKEGGDKKLFEQQHKQVFLRVK